MKKGNRILAITLSVLMAFTVIPVMNQATAFAATSSSITVDSGQYRLWASWLDENADDYQQAYEQQKRVVEDAESNGAWTSSHLNALKNICDEKEDIRSQVGGVASSMSGYGNSLDDVAGMIYDLNKRSRAGTISDMAYINKLHDIAATLRNMAAILEEAEAAINQQLGSIFAGDGLIGTYSDDDSLKITGNGSGSSDEEQSSGSIERRKIKEDRYRRYEEYLKNKRRLQLPYWLSYIGDNAFSGWTSLNNILFYNENESINVQMRISSLDEDISLLGIGKEAFAGCTGLEEIAIPASVTEVGTKAFDGCTSVETIVIEDGAEGFADHVFSGCKRLTSLEIPGSVGTVSAGFITACPNLQTIEIGEGVTEIEEEAFANNPELTDIYLPASIETIDESFLADDGNVTIHGYEGTVAEEVAKETGNDFVSLGIAATTPDSGSCGENLTWELSDDGTLTVSGEGTITSSPWVFTHSTEIKNVVIEEGVTEICDNAFRGCKNLEKVSLPDTLTAIGAQAFMYGDYSFNEDGKDGKLKSITIPSGVTTIGDAAFGVYWALDPETGDEIELTVKGFVVYGAKGSTAEAYAEQYELTFRTGTFTFTDVTDPTTFYYGPVYWAVDEGVTTGWDDGTFRPWVSINRAAVVTFLWRVNGCPEPEDIADFSDMPADAEKYQDFRKAISWAAEEKITTGYEDGTFRPWATCNRAAIAAFIWRSENKPTAAKTATFQDMTTNDEFNQAISWGVENGIITGWKEDNTFRPWKDCNRAATVTFLYRLKAK